MARRISIVIASGAGGPFLFRTLEALMDQAREHDAQVIVIDRCGPERRHKIASEFPDIELLAPELDHRPSVPELRAIGFDAAEGEIVAVIEEHMHPGPDWVATILANFRDDDAAIGGPVVNDSYGRRRDWVVYFAEYSNYMPPWSEGEYYWLNGVNIAYSREKVMAHREVLETGWWEAGLHPRLVKDGKFRSIPGMGAIHTGPFDYGYYLSQRYLLSRVWGATERARVSLAKRLVHIVATPILPLFLLARMAQRVLSKGQLTSQFLLTLPLLIPAVIVNAWGEMLGYLVGAGDALEHVE